VAALQHSLATGVEENGQKIKESKVFEQVLGLLNSDLA